MDLQYSSGNETVDRVGQIDFSLCGSVNLLPDTWYKTITYDNGKPNFIASIILSEIVYWYKPQVIKNEFTGEIIAVKPKFKADLLQRSRKSFENKFGLTEKQVKDALYFLEHKIGVIRRERRNIITDTDLSLGNVLFIDLNVERLIELTYPKSTENIDILEVSDKKTTLGTYKYQGVDTTSRSQARDLEVPRVGHKSTDVSISESLGKNIKVPTYTKNTTKTTTETTSSSSQIASTARKEKKNEIPFYEDLIADNIQLDRLLNEEETENGKQRIWMFYKIICKTITSKKKTEKINSEEISREEVKNSFLKIGYDEIRFVCDKLDEPKETPIYNLESYIKTLLYNAPTLLVEHKIQKGLKSNSKKKKNSFNNIEQRDYDFDELEKLLAVNVKD